MNYESNESKQQQLILPSPTTTTTTTTTNEFVLNEKPCSDTTLVRRHRTREIPITAKVIHIRALFNYVPQEDLYIPCKELGLGFSKGDILHIITQDDADWWQAYKNEDKDQSLAGLIPSQSFQEK